MAEGDLEPVGRDSQDHKTVAEDTSPVGAENSTAELILPNHDRPADIGDTDQSEQDMVADSTRVIQETAQESDGEPVTMVNTTPVSSVQTSAPAAIPEIVPTVMPAQAELVREQPVEAAAIAEIVPAEQADPLDRAFEEEYQEQRDTASAVPAQADPVPPPEATEAVAQVDLMPTAAQPVVAAIAAVVPGVIPADLVSEQTAEAAIAAVVPAVAQPNLLSVVEQPAETAAIAAVVSVGAQGEMVSAAEQPEGAPAIAAVVPAVIPAQTEVSAGEQHVEPIAALVPAVMAAQAELAPEHPVEAAASTTVVLPAVMPALAASEQAPATYLEVLERPPAQATQGEQLEAGHNDPAEIVRREASLKEEQGKMALKEVSEREAQARAEREAIEAEVAAAKAAREAATLEMMAAQKLRQSVEKMGGDKGKALVKALVVEVAAAAEAERPVEPVAVVPAAPKGLVMLTPVGSRENLDALQNPVLAKWVKMERMVVRSTNLVCTAMHLGGCGLADEEAKIIAQLLLSSSPLATLAGTTHHATLLSLNLEYNSITAEGIRPLAEALCDNSVLLTLKLGKNKLGVEGARVVSQALLKNTTLTLLSLGGNAIKAEGACHLALSLHSNDALLELRLGGNEIEDEGALALAHMLPVNRRLQVLHMYGNSITQPVVNEIGQLVKCTPAAMRVRVLNLGGNDCDSAAWVSVGMLVRLHQDPHFRSRVVLMVLLLQHWQSGDGFSREWWVSDGLQSILACLHDVYVEAGIKKQVAY